jgi:hypothetical protein
MAKDEDFQARATAEGKQVQKMAAAVLEGCGFTIVDLNRIHDEVGATINIVAVDETGRPWYFDVSGAFKTKRPGLKRTDTMWKTLGRANALAGVGVEPIVFLTTNLPQPDSTGGKALRATHDAYFDAVEMLTEEGRARLSAYARGDRNRPFPGFLSPQEVFGDALITGGDLGASFELPVEEAGDPLGRLHDDFDVIGLDYRFKVVVPSKDRKDRPLDESKRAEVVTLVLRMLHDYGGGCTTQQAYGTWSDPMAHIISEEVLVLETYAQEPFTEEVVRPIVEAIVHELDQEAISVCVDDKMLIFNR